MTENTQRIQQENTQKQNQLSNPIKIQQLGMIPDKIFAAEIHFSRIPYQYWEHRLQMIKSMGFNALSVYIMWNHHQIEQGKFDYENQNKDLKGFLRLAKKYEFKVFFRPGPYVCAEWDFGGFPARLLSNKNIVIRSNNKAYLEQVKIYFSSLVDIMNEFHYKEDGPIIMLQIQNEYGWYGTDKSYMNALKEIWNDLKIDLPHYYVDWFENIQKCHWEGANIGINNGIKQQYWAKTRQMEPKGYLFGGQIYSGWLTHWGQQWQGKSLKDYTYEFKFLMQNNHSFSMYMAHGGSNFALTAGANGFENKPFDYGGHITSYDYDAPINEQGAPNQKYFAFRQLAKQHATWSIPEVPKNIQMIEIKPFIPSGFADLLQNLPKPIITQSKQFFPFEHQKLKMWNQGFALYETILNKGNYNINLVIHDYALIYLNGQFIKALNRGEKISHQLNVTANKQNSQFRILVESMGHINFGAQMLTDFKGLISFKATSITDLQNKQQNLQQESAELLWSIYTLPINSEMLSWKNKSAQDNFPRLFRYNLTLNEIGDTYLNMESWQKGYLFVNGYNLGRYWNKGPQQKVFLPMIWLKKGVNDIVVLELLQAKARFIKGDKKLQQQKGSKLQIINNGFIDKV